ncbi:hypothetical protein GCM10022204_12980 [Microlunatus aurantiacus]|uniref:YjbR protein n=1 Tax=Microlunatus aurantiacus TaxID=446786 RepID=A0ABP7D1C1_9ACTN
MPCSNDDFWDLVDQLPEVTPVEGSTYTALKVRGKGFGYHWPATATAGLKQERGEQIALVSERPDVFETQFVAGQFGWVVVRLERIEPAELGELVFEAWRLTAPVRVIDAYGSRPPSLPPPKRAGST